MENFKDLEKKLYRVPTFNKLGDVEKVSYFMDITDKSEYINLLYKENITTARNKNTGLPLNRTTVKQEIKGGEVINSDTYVENFTKARAIEINQESRKNLISIASDYIVEDLITEYGENDGIQKAKAFLDTVINEREKYILGFITELISAINNTALAYITTARKSKLVEILNVVY